MKENHSIRENVGAKAQVTNSADIIGLLHKLKAFKDECAKVLDKAYSDDIGDAVSEISTTLGVAIGEKMVSWIFE